MKTLTRILLFLTVATAISFGSTVQFTGPSTGTNNGSSYVGPYNLVVDGTSIEGTCITYDIEIVDGETWSATIDSLSDFSLSDQTLYLEAEYLNLQFPFSTDWVGIHQAIWDIFEPGTFTDQDTTSWLNLAETNYSSVNPNSFSVLVPVPVSAAQTFLIPTPETNSLSMFFGGSLILLGLGKLR
jgi:hypothetical protein